MLSKLINLDYKILGGVNTPPKILKIICVIRPKFLKCVKKSRSI